ncbi:MAG: hypothetical protein LPK03_16095 [Pontibacter sp.]|nr:hypothetical protein [Pontibacter sp.]
MNTEELEERLADAERVLALHGKRLEKLEERETPAPPQFAEAPDYGAQFEELKALINRHDLSAQTLQIYAQIASFRDTITKLPKVLPVRHHHHFEDRSRVFVIGGIICLLTVAISVGLCLSLYRENSRLRDSDVKYRMIRQGYPDAGRRVDSIYHLNPEEAEGRVRQLESKESDL